MVVVKSFDYDNKTWKYVIKYKQQKHMYLKIRNDQILISAPFFMQEQSVEDFILKNITKILKIKIFVKPHIAINGNDDYVYFLSKKYPLIIKYHSQKTTIYFELTNLVMYTNIQSSEQILVKIQKFLKQESYVIFMNRLKYWSEIMGIEFTKVKVRSMISKWGICQPHTKIITLNYKLIHYSYSIIDYVVIHELAHIIYGHHQKSFWNLVAKFCPNFQDCQKILKQNGEQ